MDHEHPSESTPSGKTPDQETSLDAAHFREAARLAAARVRAALAKGASREDESTEPEAEPVIDSEVIEVAAKQQANALDEHDPETNTTDPGPAAETIEELEERLHLGARMLRVFATQIQRLEKAAHEATLATEARRAEDDAPERLELEASLTSLSERSKEQAALAGSIQQRVEIALQMMETKLARITEIEQSIATRIQRVEELAAKSLPEHEPPVIEVESQDQARNPKQPPPSEHATNVSYGTLSVDPERLQRRSQGRG